MAIVLTDISKAYGPIEVFNKFNCRIEEGTVTCVMGPSGGGKTTLLRLIAGLERPDCGQITEVSHLRKSFVFQEDRLCENLSAASNISLVCRKSVRPAVIIGAMSNLGFSPDDVRRTVRGMSGGMRRRVAVLRALMAEYDILLMDEPFSGLDAETKEKVILYTKERSKGKTAVFVTHDETEAEIMGAGVICLK